MGSLRTKETFMKNKSGVTQLTPFQNSVIYGTLLGDSYLYTKGNVQIEQGDVNKNYLDWLYQQLKSLTTGRGPKPVIRKRVDKHTGLVTVTSSHRFYTRNYFRDWKPVFYNEKGVKILPLDFSKRLDAIALAIWFLDDGGRSSGVDAGVFLTVDNYTLDEITRIQETLQEKFHITTQHYHAGKSSTGNPQRRLAISGSDYVEFFKLVSPIVTQIPSMAKKKLPDAFSKFEKTPVSHLL